MPQQQTYRAASIAPCEGACRAAYAIRNKHFLYRDVPRLPLLACDTRNCQCKHIQRKDRRNSGFDRRALPGTEKIPSENRLDCERRTTHDRRQGESSACTAFLRETAAAV